MTIRRFPHAYRRLAARGRAGGLVAVLTVAIAVAASGPAGAAPRLAHAAAAPHAAAPPHAASLALPGPPPGTYPTNPSATSSRRINIDSRTPPGRKSAASAAASATGPMTSHGGPVQNDPKVYLVFWDWTSDPKGEAPYLERFLSAVGGTPWLGVVSQYNAFEHGGMLAGVFSDPSPIPPHVTAGDVQAEALNAARHFGIGSSVNVQVVVATPTGNYPLGFGTRTADFPEGYCAYHSTFSDGYASMPYTLLPYMTDAIAIGADCGQNSVNGSAGLLDGVSIAEGHELAETITDPLINGWYANSISGEIGDLCVGNSGNITTVAGIFAVQALWSNAANGCVRDASNDPIGPASFETALNTGSL